MVEWINRFRTLRVRLTLWYILLLGLTLLTCSALLYFQLENGLLAQVDNKLERAIDRCTSATFAMSRAQRCFAETGLAVQLRVIEGQGWNLPGEDPTPAPWHLAKVGLQTVQSEQGSWRVLGRSWQGGSLQVAQSLVEEQKLLQNQRKQTLLRLPLMLLLTGLGGLFLAGRALAPIDHIRRTAQAIGDGDLTHRIAYSGSPDEVGQLAAAFDDMLDRLQAAFEREKRFTADVSHELRTPLAIVKGRIEIALSRPRTQPEYTDTLEDIGQAVERLSRLTSNLLFLARLDQGRLDWRPTVVDLENLLGALVEQAILMALTKQIRLVEDVTPGLKISGEADYLISLFLNLLDNAIKYTAFGGTVTVQATHKADTIQVAFIDSGQGIAPEHLPHLFERFYQAEAARSSGGAGLGLSIAYEIARLHESRITVESTPSRGSTFTVIFPDPLLAEIENKNALKENSLTS
jgi:heavy metal sensor kinase